MPFRFSFAFDEEAFSWLTILGSDRKAGFMRGSFNNDPNNQMKNLSNATFSTFSNSAISNTNNPQQPQHYSIGQQNPNFASQHMPGQNIQIAGRNGRIFL